MTSRAAVVALLAGLSFPPATAVAQGSAVGMGITPLMFKAGQEVIVTVTVKTDAEPIEDARLDLFVDVDGSLAGSYSLPMGTIPAHTTQSDEFPIVIPAAAGSKLGIAAWVLQGEQAAIGESGGASLVAARRFIHQCSRGEGGSARTTRVTCLYKPPQIAIGGQVRK